MDIDGLVALYETKLGRVIAPEEREKFRGLKVEDVVAIWEMAANNQPLPDPATLRKKSPPPKLDTPRVDILCDSSQGSCTPEKISPPSPQPIPQSPETNSNQDVSDKLVEELAASKYWNPPDIPVEELAIDENDCDVGYDSSDESIISADGDDEDAPQEGTPEYEEARRAYAEHIASRASTRSRLSQYYNRSMARPSRTPSPQANRPQVPSPKLEPAAAPQQKPMSFPVPHQHFQLRTQGLSPHRTPTSPHTPVSAPVRAVVSDRRSDGHGGFNLQTSRTRSSSGHQEPAAHAASMTRSTSARAVPSSSGHSPRPAHHHVSHSTPPVGHHHHAQGHHQHGSQHGHHSTRSTISTKSTQHTTKSTRSGMSRLKDFVLPSPEVDGYFVRLMDVEGFQESKVKGDQPSGWQPIHRPMPVVPVPSPSERSHVVTPPAPEVTVESATRLRGPKEHITPKDISTMSVPEFFIGITKGMAGTGSDELVYDLQFADMEKKMMVPEDDQTKIKNSLLALRRGQQVTSLPRAVGVWKSLKHAHKQLTCRPESKPGIRAATFVGIVATYRVASTVLDIVTACFGNVFSIISLALMAGKTVIDVVRGLKYRKKDKNSTFKMIRMAWKGKEYQKLGFLIGKIVNGLDPVTNKFKGNLDEYNTMIVKKKVTKSYRYFIDWVKMIVKHGHKLLLAPAKMVKEAKKEVYKYINSRFWTVSGHPVPNYLLEKITNSYADGKPMRQIVWELENGRRIQDIPMIDGVPQLEGASIIKDGSCGKAESLIKDDVDQAENVEMKQPGLTTAMYLPTDPQEGSQKR